MFHCLRGPNLTHYLHFKWIGHINLYMSYKCHDTFATSSYIDTIHKISWEFLNGIYEAIFECFTKFGCFHCTILWVMETQLLRYTPVPMSQCWLADSFCLACCSLLFVSFFSKLQLVLGRPIRRLTARKLGVFVCVWNAALHSCLADEELSPCLRGMGSDSTVDHPRLHPPSSSPPTFHISVKAHPPSPTADKCVFLKRGRWLLERSLF